MRFSIITSVLLLGLTYAVANGLPDGSDSSGYQVDNTGYNEGTTWHGDQAGELGGFGTYIGYLTGQVTTGMWNTAIGAFAGTKTTTGSGNTYLGEYAGYDNVTGTGNTLIGMHAGENVTGSNNVLIGYYAGISVTDSNKLYIESSNSNSPLIYGEFDNDLVKINGRFDVDGTITATDMVRSSLNVDDDANNHNLLVLDVNNTGSGASDVGFSMENKGTDFKWAFRTYDPSEGFAASKIGTGGTEFEVGNIGTTTGTTVVKMGGITVFENGHLVTASSRSLKTDIQPLDTQAALDAFHKLQPVSYAYKAHKDEAVVGFIAEDVPELVAMPSRKSIDSTEIVAVLTKVAQKQEQTIATMKARQKAQDDEITQLKTMQKKVAMMESILINLALDTSNTSKEKVSIK